jgi:ABC-type multidrug transport system ATPase subunit
VDRIKLENIGKKFIKKWIFKDVNLSFVKNQHYAIVGSNGSGKSTLLQVISSYMLPSTGSISYFCQDQEIPSDKVYQHMSMAGPYMELIEEFTLLEMIEFHRKIKGFRAEMTTPQIIQVLELEKHQNKAIKNFSSGMKQRVKLALAFFSDTSLLLLDEPTSNLDAKGAAWYQEQLTKNSKDRIVIICSNHLEADLFSCKEFIKVEDYI